MADHEEVETVEARIAAGISDIQAEFYGIAVRNAAAYYVPGKIVTVVLTETFTRAEKHLIAHGAGESLREGREHFQRLAEVAVSRALSQLARLRPVPHDDPGGRPRGPASPGDAGSGSEVVVRATHRDFASKRERCTSSFGRRAWAAPSSPERPTATRAGPRRLAPPDLLAGTSSPYAEGPPDAPLQYQVEGTHPPVGLPHRL